MNENLIEKGIPIPEKKKYYPIDKLKVGDSFNALKCRQAATFNQIQSACYTAAKRLKIKVKIKQIGPEEIRVWRVA